MSKIGINEGRKATKTLLRALGLDGQAVTALKLECKQNSVPTAIIEKMLTDEECVAFVKYFQTPPEERE